MPGLPQQPGTDAQEKAHQLVENINKNTTQPSIQLNQVDAEGRPTTNNFPGQWIPRHSYDDEFAMKERIIRKNPYTGEPIKDFVATVTEKDMKYMQDKEDVENYLAYEEFKQSLWDQSDPSQMWIAHKLGLTKNYTEKAIENIRHQADLQVQIAIMKLMGKSNWKDEDIQTLYNLKTGRTKLSKGPLYDPESYDITGEGFAGKKARALGFFNPRRMFPDVAVAYELRKNNDPFPEIKIGGDLVKNSDIGDDKPWNWTKRYQPYQRSPWLKHT